MRKALLAGRLLLGAVFVYAAYTKLRQPWLLFALSIDAYQLLPEWAVLTLARTLPWLELALGLTLFIGFRLTVSSALSTLLLGGFLAVMIRSYVAGLGIDCGCFGFGESLSGITLARDSLLFLGSVAMTAGSIFQQSRPRPPQPAIIAGAGRETLPPPG